MFVLEEGPRHGQLVDELPRGYLPASAEGGGDRIVVFGDYAARKAVWHREAQVDP